MCSPRPPPWRAGHRGHSRGLADSQSWAHQKAQLDRTALSPLYTQKRTSLDSEQHEAAKG